MRLGDALRQGTDLLSKGSVASPRLNAEVLLMHAASCDRAHFFAHPERELTESEWDHYDRYLKERLRGKPAQYITGHQEFCGLDFLVNPSVLIPRPETELVVETALHLAREMSHERLDSDEDSEYSVADVGTGSGCIAVALATELPRARFVAVDNSPAALETAQRNAARHEVDARISFKSGDLLEGNHSTKFIQYDLIASNPPYVSDRDRTSLMPEVSKFEPSSAVFAGPTGLETYARLIPQAAAGLRSGGYLVLELGYDSQEGVRDLLHATLWESISWHKDLAGIVRVVSARRTNRKI